MNKKSATIFWFRRDLRIQDNHGLFKALSSHQSVLPLFIFDKHILDRLENKADRRVEFIHSTLTGLKNELQAMGASMIIAHGHPENVWEKILLNYEVDAVYTNRDYEPYAKDRDASVSQLLSKAGIPFHTFKDHILLEGDEVLKDDGKPYTVFTPYAKKWRAKADENTYQYYDSQDLKDNFLRIAPLPDLPLEEIGFIPSGMPFPSKEINETIIRNYSANRNFPGINGTSKKGIHLRFGTISIRQLAKNAAELDNTYLNELVWRDFYQMILWHFPHVVDKPFKPAYEFIDWRNNEKEFEMWCNGQTGYPIVDAGMRELNETGFMHNRVRMITASFLTKHLLIDWRWGEAYFAEKLLDFELASNNGGWQWAAGCGTDAAPYFRIFNPYTQAKNFDKDLVYINKWLPELNSPAYPSAIVDHKFARERCLETYKQGLNKTRIT